uniref:hypothetical protein n=1 Tax=Salmonella sp. TaxID=599 RepID=UPI001CD9E93F|nr:hypothetical protein [Salmonella sp.]
MGNPLYYRLPGFEKTGIPIINTADKKFSGGVPRRRISSHIAGLWTQRMHTDELKNASGDAAGGNQAAFIFDTHSVWPAFQAASMKAFRSCKEIVAQEITTLAGYGRERMG